MGGDPWRWKPEKKGRQFTLGVSRGTPGEMQRLFGQLRQGVKGKDPGNPDVRE